MAGMETILVKECDFKKPADVSIAEDKKWERNILHNSYYANGCGSCDGYSFYKQCYTSENLTGGRFGHD